MNDTIDVKEKINQPKDECCPKFHVEKWDEKTFKWDNKKFIFSTIPTFFHIPISSMIGKRVTKMMNQAEGAGAIEEDMEDVLLLFHDPHAFKSELYMSVTKKVIGAENVAISGDFISKVYDGPYNAVPKFFKELDKYLDTKDKKAKKYYVHYAYCPKCAKEAGHNYMVIFAQV